MDQVLDFLAQHGPGVLFAVVLLERLGLPLPAAPCLVAAGALARSGRFDATGALWLSVVACLVAHGAWYEAGRRSGMHVLRLVCQVSLEPDACVRRTQLLFGRHGAKALVLAHFVPGLDTVAQPLAAMAGVARPRFLVLSALGAFLWAGGFLALGWAFGRELAGAGAAALRLGAWAAALALGACLSWAAWKLARRRRLLRDLRVARIGPDELKRRMDAGEPITVVDLRHPIEFAADPRTIPGALRIAAEDLAGGSPVLPPGVEVVLYCT